MEIILTAIIVIWIICFWGGGNGENKSHYF